MTREDVGPLVRRTRLEARRSFERATEHIAGKRLQEAEVCLRQAVRSDPSLVEAHANLGWLLEKQGRMEDAEASFRRSTASDPPHGQAYCLFGTFLAGLGRFDEAQATYHRALSTDPFSVGLWSNLGVLFLQTDRLDEAEHCFRTALKIDPDSVEASVNQAYVSLRHGQFDEGLTLYERRGWKNQFQARIPSPRWSGESLEGRSILVVHEGGYGDMIQFCRYVPLLHWQRGATVTVLVPPPLKALLKSLDGVATLLTTHDPVDGISWDCWTSMMSLPYHFGTRLDSVVASIPYLRASYVLAAAAPASATDLKVGLVWRGNPGFMNDTERSLPSMATLAPLSAIKGVTFVSLQRDDPRSRTIPLSAPFDQTEDPGDFADFDDLARAINRLDVVIGVDTAVIHLAAALGKPTWVLLAARLPDWRWLDVRADSPWYPGVVQLFRQETPGDWRVVIEAVAARLAELRNR